MPRRKTAPSTVAWRQSILTYVAGHPDRPLKVRALARELDISAPDYTSFRGLVRELVDEGTLVLGPGRTLRLPDQAGLLLGTYRASPRGFGFVERPGEPAVYIPKGRAGGAMEGDRVAVRLRKPRGKAAGPRGEVARIIERAVQRYVGILERLGYDWIVRPQGREAVPAIRVDNVRIIGARAGELVVVEPTGPMPGRSELRGDITTRLGDPHDARVQIQGIIERFGLPTEFDTEVHGAAVRAAARAEKLEGDGREDLLELLTITIDPPDAKDFDDAISIERLRGGVMRLGVHIADVAHYVPANGPIDQEAAHRGTSVYFPERVVPMLPEELSNETCSLRPGEPRLTHSVFITYDRHAQVDDVHFARSVIRSDARLSYEEVAAYLAHETDDMPRDVGRMLTWAEDLARRIRRRRLDDGMVTLALPEAKVQMNAKGRVIDSGPAPSSFANTIIEMFMVEANEAVSSALTRAGYAHLRRIHPPPDPTEGKNLAPLGPILGHRPPGRLDRAAILEMLDAVRGKAVESAVSYMLLRSLPQASYSPADQGHFALASRDYCHFTSPIRRYPDLTIHRLFATVLAENPAPPSAPADSGELSDADLADLGQRCSAAERRAQQAERDALRALQLLYMRTRIGQVFEGVISGVASFGVFVQLRENLAEGLVRVGDFGPDEWRFDRQQRTFVGQATGRVVCLGQSLRVLVAGVNEVRQEIALVPADGGPIGRPQRVSPRGQRRQRQREAPRGKRGRRRR